MGLKSIEIFFMGLNMKKNSRSDKSISDIISTSFNKIMSLIVVSVSIISVFVLVTGQYSANSRDFDVAVGLASDRVYWALQSYKNIVKNIGAIPLLSDEKVPVEKKEEVLSAICKEYGLVRSKIINTDGFSDMDEEPIYRGDREYFIQTMKGKVYIQEPVTSRTDGQLAIIGAAPLWKNGELGGEIAGVVFISINPMLLHNIIEGADISKNTIMYIIDSHGGTVSASDMELVYNKNNNIANSETDRSYEPIAQVEKRMLNGETGSATIRLKGTFYYLSYAPISETPGWSICIGFPYKDYMDTPILLIILLAECLLISIFIVKIRSRKIADQVAEPIIRMTNSIKKAAETGKEMVSYEGNDEIGAPIEMKIISEAMDSIMDRLDLATTDTREFLDSAVITDLVSMDMLKYINGYYKNSFGVNVIVADSRGTVLVGKTNHGLVDVNALREDESASFIMLNDRVIGSTIFKIPEECILNKEDAQQHAIYVSKILEIVAFGNFRRSLQNRNKLKQAREELEKISEYHNEIGEEARRMAAEGERVRKLGNPDALREFAGKFIGFCYDIVSRTDDFTNYNEGSDMSAHIKEGVYSVEKLIVSLREDMQRIHPGLADKMSISAASGMPSVLFGDSNGIRRLTENILLAMSDDGNEGETAIYLDSRKNSYATSLSINVRGNKLLTEKEGNRLKDLLENDIEETKMVDGVGASELKLLSIARVVKRMNGVINVIKVGKGETWCSVVIPQLEVNSDDQ